MLFPTNRHLWPIFNSAITWLLVLLMTLAGTGLIMPILAQEKPTAPIILEGRTLFYVSESGQYTAERRANDANNQLQKILAQNQPPITVNLDTTKDVPVIQIQGAYLISVTSNDVPTGRTLQEQAILWKNILEISIRKAEYERTPQYLIKSTIIAIVVLFITFIISWKLGVFWQRFLKPSEKKDGATSPSLTPPSTQPLTAIPQTTSSKINLGFLILLIVIRGIIWICSLFYISHLFPQTREWSQDVIEILKVSLITDIFPLGNDRYSVLDFFILAGLLVGLVLLTQTVSRILKSKLLSATGLNRGVQDTTALIVNYTLIFLGTIVVLQVWGLDLSSLTVFASVLGVGIGLGLQGIAKEFVSGLVLIFERPIQIGDFVEVSGLMGTVERIGVRSTEIRTLDQVSVILPNSRFLESEVINWSHYSPISRLKIPIGVAYGSDLEKVKEVLIETAKSHREVLSMPSPQVFFVEFGDSSLNFSLLVWISKPYKQFQIKSDLYFQLDTKFREEGIEIPFPQQDLNIRSSELPQTISPDLIESLAKLSDSLATWLDKNSQNSNPQDQVKKIDD
ncbi:mechanosensitive ion channel domain-containing protein [Crocosphaera sp. UHCC 0190]|uniref:mechanosensitive ion channel family protein n=1 Tax=Crocosphaera sp. UHCC 0190 TaxID=3110246 RepID=UPI002B1EFF74|nr:mechanosensitive ion channel domain-containing protein [Crocosphaera sp. UHCC 0190]MEA5510699.1 mechanosensitive ion channel domain-containing protein [Crocosphaera sp. UHCC 0190]